MSGLFNLIYDPGPTTTGVDISGLNADYPGISLLYPNENLFEF